MPAVEFSRSSATRAPLPPSGLDHAGATASMACAVHCAVMPFVITMLPFVGLGFLARESTEWILLGISAALAVSSICWGYRGHRSQRAVKFLALGLILLVWGRILDERDCGYLGVPMTVLGGLGVTASHFVNKSLCKSCKQCT